MMGMMMAPMLISALMPAFGKVGSWLSGLFGGASSKPFVANIKGAAIDSTQAAAKLSKDLKVLRQYQTEVKRGGKEEWVRDNAAYLADPLGYYKALKKYQIASGTYTGSVKNANQISSGAIADLYGSTGHLLSGDARISKSLYGHLEEIATGRGFVPEMVGTGTYAQMRALARNLPRAKGNDVRRAVLNMMKEDGANWQGFSKLIAKDKSLARGIFTDTEGSPLQWLQKHEPNCL
jgi:hypothetical protein